MAKFEADNREFQKFLQATLGKCSKCGATTHVPANVGKACRELLGGRCPGRFLPVASAGKRDEGPPLVPR